MAWARQYLRLSWRQWAVVAFLFAIALAPLPRLMKSHATSMEESSLVQYATMTANGAAPTKAYWTEYGPLNVYVPAAAFAVFGPSVTLERVVGLAYRLVLMVALYLLIRRHSKRAAWLGVALAWWLLAPWGVMAYSWLGGLACALLALYLYSPREPDQPSSNRRLAAAGLMTALALGFRPDLVLALGVGALLTLPAQRRQWKPALAGFGVGLVPYLVLVLSAGPSNALRNIVIDPLFNLRSGRALPFPPTWRSSSEFFTRVQHYIDSLTNSNWYGAPLSIQVAEFFWLLMVVGVLLAAAAVLARRAGSRSLVALFAFSFMLITNIYQRADISHLRLVGTVWVAILPLALAIVGKRWFARSERVMVVGALSFMFVATLVAPEILVADFGNLIGGRSDFAAPRNVVVNHGRSVQTQDRYEVAYMTAALWLVDHYSRPGDRFFEGPSDLRFTNYNEPSFYWLEPHLTPATYYLEMNPGIANTSTSGLAKEVASADVLLLSRRYEMFSEPNTSTKPGSPDPNVEVMQHFCVVAEKGWYVVLRHTTSAFVAPGPSHAKELVRLGGHGVRRCGTLGATI